MIWKLERGWRSLGLLAWAVAVAGLTLRPGSWSEDTGALLSAACLICGTVGTADALLNMALFLPLGFIAGGRRTILTMALVGFALSLGIEVSQFFVPGRHSSTADVLWNTTGAASGAAMRWVVATRLRHGLRGGGLAVALAAVALLHGSGALGTPAPSDGTYWGQWTPDFDRAPQYDGAVLTARLNDRILDDGPMRHPEPHREQLESAWSLRARVVLGRGAYERGVAPIVSVSDIVHGQVLVLGKHRDLLVFRERSRADVLRFATPDVRVAGAFASVAPGDTVTIAARSAGGRTCLSLAERDWCGVGIAPGRAWGYLIHLDSAPLGLLAAADLGFLVLLFAPVGFFARSRREVAVGSGLGGSATLGVVVLTSAVWGGWAQFVAASLGPVVGWLALQTLSRSEGLDQSTASRDSSV